MPEFDDSFISNCALAERQHIFSYSLDRGSKLYQRRRLKSPNIFSPYRPRVVVKNVIRYSAISSPSTPNSSLSSQSNLVNSPSPNSSSPGGGGGVGVGGPLIPGSGQPGSSGHKNSLKGTKLARRARSFKDDLFEKISLMRTPTNTLGRAHSPNSPRNKQQHSKPPPTAEEVAKSSQSLETHVKDISNALKHFRDVILKKKLEVLPGNGTVILETIASMYAVIQSYTLNEQSTVLVSATQQVYQSLGKLIKFCDEVMLNADENGDECATLSNENVKEVVDLLEDAVRNLVTLAQQKLKEKEQMAHQYGGGPDSNSLHSSNHLMRPPIEVPGQRTSLPDITLTPKERDILEKTKSNPIRVSYSTESILRDTSPPPKPPLPHRSDNPPPLPPKQRRQQNPHQSHQPNQFSNSINSDLDCSSDFSLMNYGVDHLSVRSRSPDENSSQCSLDSALNHSREEEELRALALEGRLEDNLLEDDVEKMFAIKTKIVGGGGGGGGNSAKDSTATAITGNHESERNQRAPLAVADSVGSGFSCGVPAAAAAVAVAAATNSTAAISLAAGLQNVAAATVLTGTNAATTTTTASSSTTNGIVSASSGAANSIMDNKPEMRKTAGNNNRHSNESGYVSVQSFRTSTQSVSKRSSDYSFQSASTTKSSSSNSEIGSGFGTVENVSASDFQFQNHHQQQHHQIQQLQQQQQQRITSSSTVTSTTTASSKVFSTTTTTMTMGATDGIVTIGSSAENDNHSLSNTSSASPDLLNNHHHVHHQQQQQQQQLLHQQQQQIGGGTNAVMHSLTSLNKTNSLDISSSDDLGSYTDLMPPALPPKLHRCSTNSKDRNIDELDDNNSFDELPELRHHTQFANHLQQSQLQSSQYQHVYQWQSKHQSLIEPRHAAGRIAGSLDGNLDEPPPLPMKKKHILAYMEICSSTTRSIEQHRHTMHAYNLNRNITHSQTMNIVPLSKESNSPDHEDEPPALPPKNYKQRKPSAVPPTIITTPPPSPKPTLANTEGGHHYNSGGGGGVGGSSAGIGDNVARNSHGRILNNSNAAEQMTTVCEEMSDLTEEEQMQLHHSHQLPNETDQVQKHDKSAANVVHGTGSSAMQHIATNDEDDEGIDVVLDHHNNYNNNINSKHRVPGGNGNAITNLPNMLEVIDIAPYLVFKKEQEDGPEVKGGYIDALIVHASRVQKDNAFSEAFITTFRTFIQPIDVIEKLTHRYTVFFCHMNDQKQKAAKETFSLLVRVVNDLTATDLTSELFALLGEFVYQLVCSGELYMAKLLRNKYVEKVMLYKEQRAPVYQPNPNLITNQPSLLDLKSAEIAEQMTLLDAELFQKIEIPEVLLFAKEQCEEKSPNLNKFTEHFNKMSYWARSKILMLEDAKEREKHVIKFIKIMKHLRKMNNYNSYLALLSALDSAPIRRLEWHKTITEGLKEYCTLIDSSSSFRVYRQALAETNPPCIPYIGLVLQDLTFVHVGNPDYLREGVINFSKRWQQHNIIVNMKRFKKCAYPFRRNERIISFFENFDKHLGEEEMWQISEHIKPRGKRPTHN